MKIYRIIRNMRFVLLLAAACCCGCNSQMQQAMQEEEGRIYSRYMPETVELTSLSEIVYEGKNAKVKVFVNLKDSFGIQMKAPATFRFELYQKVPRAMEQKGKRIFIWPDIDLTQPAVNNQYWRDFMRSYEFELSGEQLEKREYVLQVTCTLGGGKKLFTEYAIKAR